MMTCPRCGTPAILMASEEFKLLDCEFCDDVIDLSLIDQGAARARAGAGLNRGRSGSRFCGVRDRWLRVVVLAAARSAGGYV